MHLVPSVSISQWVQRVIRWVLSPKGGLIILLSALFTAFVAVMLNKNAEEYIAQLLGLSGNNGLKNEILTFLGLSMGGALLAIQALIANTRAEAMEKAALEQAKANENTEKGQRQERLKNAIEHLGHDSVSIRLGGTYELFHLAQDTEELRQTILDILCSHIRRTTSEDEYRDNHKSKPSEEIQSLLTLLFVQKHEVFRGLHINLKGSYLNGADLNDARLVNAILDGAYLRGASLGNARLQGARLFATELQEASLCDAQLQGTILVRASLQRAWLDRAQLRGAMIESVRLQGSQLGDAQLQGALLQDIFLQGAVLVGTQLHGAISDPFEFSSFEKRIRDRIDEESDLSGVTFEGGLSNEDMDSLVEGLSDYATQALRRTLAQHIDKPASHELPENSSAITGSYTKREAEQWITEYKEAVPDDSEEDNS